MMKIVLASSSPYRRELLSRFNLPFDVVNPDIDESPRLNETAKEISVRLAREKAVHVTPQYGNSLIIGSDTTAECEGRIIEKPMIHSQAVSQLKFLSGNLVKFYTSLCLLNTETQALQQCVVDFEVKYKVLTEKRIESYLLKEQPYNCVGSIKSEGLGIILLEYIKGEDPTALIGLPLMKLSEMLQKEGVTFE
ncbi:septum formation protein Maf [Candidatus Methylopumilus planktonicus]|nr:Maf family nucleotide pyrophosphatase [Candidatus Methylopumilus planktonicus]QDD01664.1 septum formation protein Maf [Candidatus Methylopumilus planktonicus]QDD06961.1 septum formation protein Maf [Candidatus Methylopumilus planktonicus]QDD08295.1 septum formation protein Maf [Candidatus Methylopumilus planktonicus]QDD09622.1 septum formation protein Maf [Candidatus Methylopumilus planktonicus]